MKTMAPAGNPFLNNALAGGWAGQAPAAWPPSCHHQAVAHAHPPSVDNALILYNPNSYYGLYCNEHVNGPFATGLQANPFTPGLSPLSEVPKPSYAVRDPLQERYPATRAADDPLNWITEDLFCVSQQRAQISQQRASLRDMSGRMAPPQ